MPESRVGADNAALAGPARAAPDLTIALDPYRPGRDRAWLVEYGIPIRALSDSMGRDGGDEAEIAQTATDYQMTVADSRTAVAYYRKPSGAAGARWQPVAVRRRFGVLHHRRPG